MVWDISLITASKLPEKYRGTLHGIKVWQKYQLEKLCENSVKAEDPGDFVRDLIRQHEQVCTPVIDHVEPAQVERSEGQNARVKFYQFCIADEFLFLELWRTAKEAKKQKTYEVRKPDWTEYRSEISSVQVWVAYFGAAYIKGIANLFIDQHKALLT